MRVDDFFFPFSFLFYIFYLFFIHPTRKKWRFLLGNSKWQILNAELVTISIILDTLKCTKQLFSSLVKFNQLFFLIYCFSFFFSTFEKKNQNEKLIEVKEKERKLLSGILKKLWEMRMASVMKAFISFWIKGAVQKWRLGKTGKNFLKFSCVFEIFSIIFDVSYKRALKKCESWRDWLDNSMT